MINCNHPGPLRNSPLKWDGKDDAVAALVGGKKPQIQSSLEDANFSAFLLVSNNSMFCNGTFV